MIKIKRLIIAFSILLLCISFSVFSYFKLCKLSEEFSVQFSFCAEKVKEKDYTTAIRFAEKIEESFEKHNKFIGAVVGDDIVDTLHSNIPSIKHLLNDENYAKALEVIRACQHTAEEIPKGEKISIDNIF